MLSFRLAWERYRHEGDWAEVRIAFGGRLLTKAHGDAEA